MVENTGIEWCDHTFNPWVGCQKVSPECDLCYAEAQNKRAENMAKDVSFHFGDDERKETVEFLRGLANALEDASDAE